MSYPFVAAGHHGGAQTTIKRLVIHGTVSPTVRGGARGVARYFATTPKQTSAHYVVDPGEIIQCVPDSVIAWHDGTNSNSIGIELCDPVDGPAARWSDSAHVSMLSLASNLVRELATRYSIPMVRISPQQIRNGAKGVCGHVDMRDAFPGSTTHFDPGPAFPWAAFMHMVTSGAGGVEDMWPDKLDDYAAGKGKTADSNVLMAWTIAKVRWIDERTQAMERVLNDINRKLDARP